LNADNRSEVQGSGFKSSSVPSSGEIKVSGFGCQLALGAIDPNQPADLMRNTMIEIATRKEMRRWKKDLSVIYPMKNF
jgi:hypothetical protein